jgi:hypothetical protein
VGTHGGQVPDFVTLDYWPTFNLADASVTIGIIVVIVSLLFGHHEGPSDARGVTASGSVDVERGPQRSEREEAP